MLFAVRFHDNPSAGNVRAAHFRAHIDWLKQRREQILIAGSLRESEGSSPIGGLWIVEAQDKAEVETLLRSDPFWVHGLRRGVEIHRWSTAFAEPVTIAGNGQ